MTSQTYGTSTLANDQAQAACIRLLRLGTQLLWGPKAARPSSSDHAANTRPAGRRRPGPVRLHLGRPRLAAGATSAGSRSVLVLLRVLAPARAWRPLQLLRRDQARRADSEAPRRVPPWPSSTPASAWHSRPLSGVRGQAASGLGVQALRRLPGTVPLPGRPETAPDRHRPLLRLRRAAPDSALERASVHAM